MLPKYIQSICNLRGILRCEYSTGHPSKQFPPSVYCGSGSEVPNSVNDQNQKIDNVLNEINDMKKRIRKIDSTLDNFGSRLDSMNRKINELLSR